MKLIGNLIALACAALITACSGPSSDVLVAFMDERTSPSEHTRQIENAGGTLLAPILRNTGQLTNKALPDGTTDLDASFISISHFDDERAENAFVADLGRGTRASFIAKGKKVGWLPFIGRTEPPEALRSVTEPAFVLVNLIEQRSMANPRNAMRMLEYLTATTPGLRAEGVDFASPVLIDRVIIGDPDADLLFLTIWPNLESFQAIHGDPDFIERARRTRNTVFQGFTENRVILWK